MILLHEVAGRLQSKVKQTTQAINRLHNLLARVFPELATLEMSVLPSLPPSSLPYLSVEHPLIPPRLLLPPPSFPPSPSPSPPPSPPPPPPPPLLPGRPNRGNPSALRLTHRNRLR